MHWWDGMGKKESYRHATQAVDVRILALVLNDVAVFGELGSCVVLIRCGCGEVYKRA